jgi:hypothetical protein
MLAVQAMAQPSGYPVYPNQAVSWLVVGTGTEKWTTRQVGQAQVSTNTTAIVESAVASFVPTANGPGTISYSWNYFSAWGGEGLSGWEVYADGQASTPVFSAFEPDNGSATGGPFALAQNTTYWLAGSGYDVSATVSYPAMVMVTNSAERTATYTGFGNVQASQGAVNLGFFSAEPQPLQGGTVSGVSFTLTGNNPSVILSFSDTATTTTTNPTANVIAKTVAAPLITSSPQSLSVDAGGSASFIVSASGAAPLTYQWYYNASPILGANGTNYGILNAFPTNAGAYSVVVSNGVGAVLSAPATLTVLTAVTNTPTGCFTWTTNDGTISITGYTCSDGAVVIPSTITGLPVNGIGAGAFAQNTNLTSISIPDGVTSIGDDAFYWTKISSIAIPDSVTNIGEGAFYACFGLSAVTIPARVVTIGIEAFGGCLGLMAITVDSQNPFYSSANGVLLDKSQTTLVEFPAGLGGNYTIPNNITDIGEGAFYSGSLSSVTIPSSVTNVGEYAFCGGGLTAITVDAENPFYSSVNGVLFTKGQNTLVEYPGSGATSYIVPDTVTTIGPAAFCGQYNLTNVTIPIGVSTIGDEAFFNCSGLTAITIPVSVTSIGSQAFAYCESLTNIGFLGNAPTVGAGVFSDDPATICYVSGASGWTSPFAGLPASPCTATPPTEPADTNGAYRITIDEVTAYGAAWRKGILWPIGPNPIPIDYVTWAGYLWKAGECYTYLSSTNPPFCWVSQPCAGGGVRPEGEAASASSVPRSPLMKEAGDSIVTRAAGVGGVSIHVSPDPGVTAYAVEETVPAALTPNAISEDGSWDEVNRKIRWGLFLDSTPRTLSYEVGGTAGVYPLSGMGSFDGRSAPVQGAAELDLESSLRVAAGSPSSSGAFQISFPTELGRAYYVERTASLASQDWQVAAGPIAGTGKLITWAENGPAAAARPGQPAARYFRVRSTAQP